MKKVAHITIIHPRYDVRIFHKMCLSLSKTYNVTLICADSLGNEVKNKIKILDIGKFTNLFTRIIKNYKIYMFAKKQNFVVYHFHDPELLIIAYLLARKGKKVIFDSHEDIEEDIINKDYLPFFVNIIFSKIYGLIEIFVLKKINGVVAATPFIKKKLIKINQKTIDVCNFPSFEDLQFKKITKKKELNNVCYVGEISKNRGIFEILQALKLSKSKVKLNLAGYMINPQLEKKLKKMKEWKNVKYYGFLNRKRLNQVFRKSSIGIVTLHPFKKFFHSLPIKLFEYMLNGLPVIASNFPSFKNIVHYNKKKKCGVLVDPRNPQEIADAIDVLLSNPKKRSQMGNFGKKIVKAKFNWKNEEKKLKDFYKLII